MEPDRRAIQNAEAASRGAGRRVRSRWILLVVPAYIAFLVPGISARQSPELFGFPFFYWWQFLWIILTALLTGAAYLMMVRER